MRSHQRSSTCDQRSERRTRKLGWRSDSSLSLWQAAARSNVDGRRTGDEPPEAEPRVLRERSPRLERKQESDQIGFLVVGEADAEALIVEVDDRTQVARRAVVEIRCARREPPEDRTLE